MDFHKVETTNNFAFGSGLGSRIRVTDHGSSVFRLTLVDDRWPRGTDSQANLTPGEFAATPSRADLSVGSDGEISFGWEGRSILSSQPGRGFGICGSKWVFALDYDADDRFYGLGEKHLGFELSGKRTKFWNTDEFGDFAMPVIAEGKADPSYASFPVLIVRHQGLWAAVVIDNPHCVFVNTGAGESIFQPGTAPFVAELFFGARNGAPDVWFLADDTAAGLVRKVQSLQGRVPLPPVWALGHQQCRWGYKSARDLNRVAAGFARHGIPNDGLWLDIDYMDGFRVFTVDGAHFSDVKAQVDALTSQGHRVVPILDPGLRRDPAYRVYDEARKADILCRNPEGDDYVGYVWPGYTVFPDFSLPEAREFWSQEVKEFTDLGFGGYWIDMNDPATGSVPHEDMLFGKGKLPHSAYHNQYALGMAEATRRGIQASRPGERPFVLSRSAYLSSGRHTALWTGDNISNDTHMAGTIALTLNLSVSGMPFNGPDVPGFAEDASTDLMRAWYKLGFLFPFLRNHKVNSGADQEPWSRDPRTTQIVGDYIRLRYKLLPYLYQTFVAQAAVGDPMLRPVWYHDPSRRFDRTDDMFFVGPAILQAPFTSTKARVRSVSLPQHPAGTDWFDVDHGKFVSAGQTTVHRSRPETTPLFLASPSILPLQRGIRQTNRNDFSKVDLLVVLREGQEAVLEYQLDDGISDGYERGEVSRFTVRVGLSEGKIDARVSCSVQGAGGLEVRLLILTDSSVRKV
ncbi:MAG TPA: TIM-barrel domain-containing protein, partial [Spirochaetia bacterium]|nr:TIM-barrel domain-containing protein [Spirochaetia bacterium]